MSLAHKLCLSELTKNITGFAFVNPKGDEEIGNIYFCLNCKKYFVDWYYDTFMDGESYSYQEKISEKNAWEIVKLAKDCKDPYKKTCNCTSHQKIKKIIHP